MTTTRIENIGAKKEDDGGVPLREIITVAPRFLRSVNLERDFFSDTPLDGYITTPTALMSLVRLSEGVSAQHARAFTLTGPYGSGKSAFALFASRFLSQHPSTIGLRKAVALASPAISQMFQGRDQAGFLPVLLTGAREPLGRSLWLGLFRAIQAGSYTSTLNWMRQQWTELGAAEVPSARQVVDLFSSVAAKVRHDDSSCNGLLVIVDELGKLLEFAAIHPEQGDLQVLQELAEYAVRSGNDPILFVTILHQGFEEYAVRLSAQQRSEWKKVQGRFQDVPFSDGHEDTMRLVAQAIQQGSAIRQFEGLSKRLDENMQACLSLKLTPPTLTATEFQEVLRAAYPLHPLTLRVLPFVFKRFGQNERSLFSFLSSAEPYGFQEFLHSTSISDRHVPFLTLDMLYDYIVATLGPSLYSHATSKLWAETADALVRLRDSDVIQSRLVKSIGLMHILGEQTRVLPSKEVLGLALSDTNVSPAQIDEAIAKLQTATLITYRKFKNAYRPYEGSDIDIDARLREAQSHFSHGADGVSTANNGGGSAPIVARRHSYQKGTLRFYEVRYCRPSSLEHEATIPPVRADGLLLLCVTPNNSDVSKAATKALELSRSIDGIIIGVAVETEMLHEAAVSVECLRWVQDNTPELRNDRVALRELRERLIEATSLFNEQWESLLRPDATAHRSSSWCYNGTVVEIRSYRNLQELISLACDQAYSYTPTLQNELINRRQISSTAAAARRNLIDVMIKCRNEYRLGIEGFPPEASMYRSVLESTGIHRAGSDGRWEFSTPTKDDALTTLWSSVDTYLFGGVLAPKSLIDLITLMRTKPHGLTEGVIPVMVCAFLLQHERELAIYEDGAFITDLDAATFERMIKQPQGFHIQGCRISGEREQVLERFARGLLPNREEYGLVDVVRRLYREYNRLPEYTRKTRSMSENARAVRDLLKLGREPEQLLFVDLPAALGQSCFVAEDTQPENSDTFFTLWNTSMSEVVGAYGVLLSRAEDFLLQELTAGKWEDLRERANAITRFATDMKLKSFVLRLSDAKYERQEWIEAVAAGVTGKPPSHWNDDDEGQFQTVVSSLASAFRSLELLAFEKGRVHEGSERIGYRIAVTSETGREDARITLVDKDNAASIEALSAEALTLLNTLLMNYSEEIRIAVISRMTQTVLQGEIRD